MVSRLAKGTDPRASVELPSAGLLENSYAARRIEARRLSKWLLLYCFGVWHRKYMGICLP